MQLYHVQRWAEHTLNINKTGQKGQQTVRVPSKDPRAQAFTGVQDLYVTCRQNMYTIRTLAAAGGNPKDASDQEKLRANVLPCLASECTLRKALFDHGQGSCYCTNQGRAQEMGMPEELRIRKIDASTAGDSFAQFKTYIRRGPGWVPPQLAFPGE